MTITAGQAAAGRLLLIERRIHEACSLYGRQANSVELVAVSKQQVPSSIRTVYESGQLSFGENYVQEFVSKQAELSDLAEIRWHFIGHLQSNKAKSIVGRCKLIQSIDSERIAGKIDGIAARLEIRQDILVEVNIGNEPAKSGVPFASAIDLCEKIRSLKYIKLIGLMGIAPSESRNSGIAARESFGKLKSLFDQLPDANRITLSMGMSGDFVEAIAEGSTMVRVGTAIFGQRSHQEDQSTRLLD